jgi:hypothetical protein
MYVFKNSGDDAFRDSGLLAEMPSGQGDCRVTSPTANNDVKKYLMNIDEYKSKYV